MNKALKSLALTLLATSAAFAYTNQTTIALRSHGYNLARDYTTFNELVNRKADDKFGANFQVTGFYQGTNSGKELGKYFGIANKYEMILGHAAVAADANALVAGADLDIAYLIHDNTGAAGQATIKFNPRSESYGAAFAYYQDLDKLLKGLYLSVSLPVVRVENDMRMTVKDDAATGATLVNVTDYFKGSFSGLNLVANAQEKLAKGKIDGKRAETGVADIEIKLGYNFLEKDTYHLGLNLGLTVPTGNEHKADYLFPAIVGNGKHFAIGAGLAGEYRVWGEEDHNIKLGMALDYRYLFEHAEYRTPGLKKNDGTTLRNWGQYHLLGDNKTFGVGVEGTKLTPAANVITQNCDVTPGSQLEGLANVAYNNGGFSFDLGYNMFWKDKEDVKAKTSLAGSQYGVANRSMLASTGVVTEKLYTTPATTTAAGTFGGLVRQFDEGAAGTATDAVTKYYLAQSNLDYASAATPAVWTHKIYSGFGYSFKEWDTPLMMGVGGSYEFASKNSSPDFWSVFGKLGVAF